MMRKDFHHAIGAALLFIHDLAHAVTATCRYMCVHCKSLSRRQMTVTKQLVPGDVLRFFKDYGSWLRGNFVQGDSTARDRDIFFCCYRNFTALYFGLSTQNSKMGKHFKTSSTC